MGCCMPMKHACFGRGVSYHVSYSMFHMMFHTPCFICFSIPMFHILFHTPNAFGTVSIRRGGWGFGVVLGWVVVVLGGELMLLLGVWVLVSKSLLLLRRQILPRLGLVFSLLRILMVPDSLLLILRILGALVVVLIFVIITTWKITTTFRI